MLAPSCRVSHAAFSEFAEPACADITTAGELTLDAAVGADSAYLTESEVVPKWENLMNTFFEKGSWTLMDEIHASDRQWNDAVAGKLSPLYPHPSAAPSCAGAAVENATASPAPSFIFVGTADYHNKIGDSAHDRLVS